MPSEVFEADFNPPGQRRGNIPGIQEIIKIRFAKNVNCRTLDAVFQFNF